MASLSLKHIYKKYPGGVTAVSDFCLEIKDKEFLIFVGPSGCGKTTTLRMVAGLEEISEGELFIGDRLVNDVAPKDRKIAMVFQNYALYPHMTVKQNILFPLQNLKGEDKMTKEQMLERAFEAAKLVQIDELMDRKPSELSGGQQQRVAIARALMLSPDILCFDEPTSSLDPELTGEVLRVIRDLKGSDRTMIVVTHEMEFARNVADKIIFMADGVIEEMGPPEQIFDHPTSEKTKAFLHSSLELSGKAE